MLLFTKYPPNVCSTTLSLYFSVQYLLANELRPEFAWKTITVTRSSLPALPDATPPIPTRPYLVLPIRVSPPLPTLPPASLHLSSTWPNPSYLPPTRPFSATAKSQLVHQSWEGRKEASQSVSVASTKYKPFALFCSVFLSSCLVCLWVFLFVC